MEKCIFAFLLVVLSQVALAFTEIGTWYDDLQSPDYFDATLTIQNDNGNYYISRKNGDGSGGRYLLEKSGNSYIKVGDKFGAKYVVTEKGLEIHDKKGYIRTAKPKMVKKTPPKSSQHGEESNSLNGDSEIIKALDAVGKKITETSENRAIKYVNSSKVEKSELLAYKAVFRTSHQGLMSRKDADKNAASKAYNIGVTTAWDSIFCKPEVQALIKKHKISVISANLENEKGEIQSMALCIPQ